MRKPKRLVALALLCAGCGNFIPPEDIPGIREKSEKKKIELHGHRGARGLAPENTWPAFELGIRGGMTAIELDIVLTADGELIIHHDFYTNPKNCRRDDGTKIHALPISRLTVADLKRLDCGSLKNEKFPEQKLFPRTRLLTLPEFFERVRTLETEYPPARDVIFNLDAKFSPRVTPTDAYLTRFAQLLIKEAETAGMLNRIMVQSFEIRLLPFVKEQKPGLRTAALFQWSKWPGVGKRTPETMMIRAEASEADIVAPHYKDTDKALVELVHKKQMAIIPWTVNEPELMRSLLQLGVDGIISDYPDRLKRVATELGFDATSEK
ncbi:MAG: glycerophosphodiester phosphodiesterase [Spirochaetes bacterium]|nr:glycerophosphodiester phosphodiesterase [Spirochaetota bacterium]